MKIKGVLVDIINKRIETREVEDTLEEYYNLLNCDMIEIVSRHIGGKDYDIICDEEGLLKVNPIVSAFDSLNQPMLVGNLFIVNYGGNGKEASLTEEDIDHILKFGHLIETKNGQTNVAIRVEY